MLINAINIIINIVILLLLSVINIIIIIIIITIIIGAAVVIFVIIKLHIGIFLPLDLFDILHILYLCIYWYKQIRKVSFIEIETFKLLTTYKKV